MSQLTPFRCRKFLPSTLTGVTALLSFGALSIGTLWSGSAEAHIELMEPVPRYDGESNKSCPCGEGPSNRSCNTTADQTTDPNRNAERVTQYEAGSTITVYFDEYINHQGRFRVAFDADGADQSDFNANVLADVPDPNDAAGPRQMQITLPDTPCENCTLQLIQAMNNDEINPVINPGDFSTYYTCADIRLVAPGQADVPPVDDGEVEEPAGDPAPNEEVDSAPENTEDTNASTDATSGDSDLNQQADLPGQDSAAVEASTEELTGEDATVQQPTASAGGLESSPNFMEQDLAANEPVIIGMPMQRQSTSSGGCSVAHASGAPGRAPLWSVFGLVGLLGLGLRRRSRN